MSCDASGIMYAQLHTEKKGAAHLFVYGSHVEVFAGHSLQIHIKCISI